MCRVPLVEQPQKYRHRWEMPLIWASVVATIIALMIGGVLLSYEEQELTATFGEFSDLANEVLSYFWIILAAPFLIFVARFWFAAKARANAIRVGPRQMPALWAIYSALGQQMGQDPLPALYVTNGNGVVNAYALSCNSRRKYVVIHSEIAMLAERDPRAVTFVLAHELAHHRLGHVALWRIVAGIIPGVLFPLGTSTTRAQEYSADRLAMACCGDYDNTLKMLAAGPWMIGDIDSDAWLEQCEQERGEMLIRAANLGSDHPVLVKRYKALRDIEANGFLRNGDMV